jgi:hypothetical protein
MNQINYILTMDDHLVGLQYSIVDGKHLLYIDDYRL